MSLSNKNWKWRNNSVWIWKMIVYKTHGRSHWGGQGDMSPLPPTSISELNKVQKFQFQTSRILLFTDVQKLCGPEILQFLPSMLQFLDNLWWLFIFSNYIGEIDHFTVDLLKISDTYRWTFWKLSFCGPSERTPQRTRAYALDYRSNPGTTEKVL